MNKIITIQQIEKAFKNIKQSGKIIVLAGGCFDILHRGHLEFMEKAKNQGEILTLLLESDESTKKHKGGNRPVNKQEDRAYVLSKLEMVDFVICLPFLKNDQEYFDLVEKIKPDIIAVTGNDKRKREKTLQAKRVGAKLIEVIKLNKKYSTSKILKKLSI